MKPSKPITPKMREKANALYRIMQDGKWHTKEEHGKEWENHCYRLFELYMIEAENALQGERE